MGHPVYSVPACGLGVVSVGQWDAWLLDVPAHKTKGPCASLGVFIKPKLVSYIHLELSVGVEHREIGNIWSLEVCMWMMRV